jgi:hypothetical protein
MNNPVGYFIGACLALAGCQSQHLPAIRYVRPTSEVTVPLKIESDRNAPPDVYVFDDANNCTQGALMPSGNTSFSVNVQPGKEVAIGAFWRRDQRRTTETCSVIISFLPTEGRTYEAIARDGTGECFLGVREKEQGSTHKIGSKVSSACDRIYHGTDRSPAPDRVPPAY